MRILAALAAAVVLVPAPSTPVPGPISPRCGTPSPLPRPATAVEGRVVDENGRPLLGAQIVVEGTGLGALSATDGRYRIGFGGSEWAGREVTLEFLLIGYERHRETVRLSGGTVTVDATLATRALELQEITTLAAPAARARTFEDASARPVLPPAVGSGGPASPRPGSREGYARIVENAFRASDVHPLSTFSVDVDRASYANVRRFLAEGRLPPVDAVRIEELVNYFPYEDPEPRGGAPFSVTTEVAPAPWQRAHRLVRIGLKARSVDTADLPPANLVFLLDVSGSMASPDKLPLLKTALRMLVDQLRPEDCVSIVVYAGSAGLVLPPTPGDRRAEILDALERLRAGGSTAGGAGIRLAYRVAAENHVAGGNNRVILATDGDFNVGASSDAEMVRLIEQEREQGTFLTVLGFGTGNLQDAKMEQIADHGNGSYAYIDSALEARKVLVGEMGGTLLTVAKDVKIQVEFNPARVAAYRLIGYENRLLAAEDFDDDAKDAGEIGAGHSVTALYEVVPVGVTGTAQVNRPDSLRYRAPAATTGAGDGDELVFVKVRYKQPEGGPSRLLERVVRASDARSRVAGASESLRFGAAVAAWGMTLRESEHVGDFSLADVARLARGALGDDPAGYRAEFVRLVEASSALADGTTTQEETWDVR